LGGNVGLKALHVSASLRLSNGDVGVFMLNKVNGNSIANKFKPYGAVQGFYKYDLYNDLAINPFNKKQDISNTFYKEIMSHTDASYKEVSHFDVKSITAKHSANKSALVLGITSFSPTTASAGTKSVLTINGTDFGTTQGKVGFSNADEGGNGNYIDALDTQVLSWTNNQITVEIPSEAGTGRIRVTHNDNNITVSADDLTISYSELNVIHDPGSGDQAYQLQHIDDNGNGGYTWEMHTDFFNDTEHPGARAAFERAFDNWRCNTEINWVISGTPTTTDVIGVDVDPADGELEPDDVNVIRFDNGNELDTNVLGTCYSWYTGCSFTNGTVEWYVTKMDIVFDDDTNWNFSTGLPALSEYDFESVALHELGHGHQLGHVINTNDVMHYAISIAEDQRVLANDDITAAIAIQSRSTGSSVCNEDPMTDSTTCSLNVEDNVFNDTISIFPNPATGEFFIRKDVSINVENASIYDVSGRLMLNIDITNTNEIITVNVSGWSKGIYFVNINYENTAISKKIILN